MTRGTDYKRGYRPVPPPAPPRPIDRWITLQERLIALSADIDLWRADYLKTLGDDAEQRRAQVIADILFSFTDGDEAEQEILRDCARAIRDHKVARANPRG